MRVWCLVVRAMHGRAVRKSVERKRGRVDVCKLHAAARLMQANHSVGGNCIQDHARIMIALLPAGVALPPAGIAMPPVRSVLQSELGGELPACGTGMQSLHSTGIQISVE